MKTFVNVLQLVGADVLLVLAISLFAMAVSGCAHGPQPPNPCIGPAYARKSMPCTCPASTDPTCYPFVHDATRKPKKEQTR